MSAEKDQEDQGGGEKKRLTFIIVVQVGRKSGIGSLAGRPASLPESLPSNNPSIYGAIQWRCSTKAVRRLLFPSLTGLKCFVCNAEEPVDFSHN
jgi:hypothetical protein